MTPTTPGPRFRIARERLGLTQVQAAALCGTGQSNISEFEGGKKPVGLETQYDWCLACGIDPSEVDKRFASVRV